MTDDLLDRLEAQLMEAAGRRPRRRPAMPALAAAAAVLAVLLLGGGLLAVLGSEGGSSEVAQRPGLRPLPPTTQGAPTPPARTRTGPFLQVPGSTGPSGATGAAPPVPGNPARFAAQELALCPVDPAAGGATGQIKLSGTRLDVTASGLRLQTRYAAWFYNRPDDAVPIGFIKYSRATRSIVGFVEGLPREAQDFRYVIVTRERRRRIAEPTDVLLRSRPITDAGAGRPRPC